MRGMPFSNCELAATTVELRKYLNMNVLAVGFNERRQNVAYEKCQRHGGSCRAQALTVRSLQDYYAGVEAGA